MIEYSCYVWVLGGRIGVLSAFVSREQPGSWVLATLPAGVQHNREKSLLGTAVHGSLRDFLSH